MKLKIPQLDAKNPPKIINKKLVNIGEKVVILNGSIIYPNNYILGNTFIGQKCEILPFNFIQDCMIKNNVKIQASTIEKSEINDNCKIGVYAHLREGTKLGKNCNIGNFCEIKNSTVGDNTKMAHLAYVGDSEIGKNCNIGCGVIFANYDGNKKNKIIVEDNVFIGSNSVLIAPLKISKGTYICANTVVTENTNVDDFVIGRVRAIIKSGKGKGRYNPTA